MEEGEDGQIAASRNRRGYCNERLCVVSFLSISRESTFQTMSSNSTSKERKMHTRHQKERRRRGKRRPRETPAEPERKRGECKRVVPSLTLVRLSLRAVERSSSSSSTRSPQQESTRYSPSCRRRKHEAGIRGIVTGGRQERPGPWSGVAWTDDGRIRRCWSHQMGDSPGGSWTSTGTSAKVEDEPRILGQVVRHCGAAQVQADDAATLEAGS